MVLSTIGESVFLGAEKRALATPGSDRRSRETFGHRGMPSGGCRDVKEFSGRSGGIMLFMVIL